MKGAGELVRISVCVANFNGESVIAQCLASLDQQRVAAELEVIVHDDASRDGSVALIESQFPDVRLLISDTNIGFCLANNRMAEVATGDYLLLLNNDAWLADDALATLLEYAQHQPGPSILTLPQLDAISGELLDCGMLMDFFANPVPLTKRRERNVAMVMGACLWLPASLWRELGGFPAWFGSMAEDMYICNHARLLGYPVIALADSAYHHHVGHSFGGGKVVASGLVTTFKRRRLSERNKLFVSCLFYPPLAFWLLLPLQILALLVEGVLLSLLKRDWRLFREIYGPAVWALITHRGLLIGERRRIQGRRRSSLRQYFSVFSWLPYKFQMLARHGLPRVE